MACYLALNVHLDKDAKWFQELRERLRDYEFTWHNSFHITVAYMDKMPQGADYVGALDRCLKDKPAPTITLDRLDLFEHTRYGRVIYISSTNSSPEFVDMTNNARRALEEIGCRFNPNFLHHITLGTIKEDAIDVSTLKNTICKVKVEPFTQKIAKAEFIRAYRRAVLCAWKFS